MSLISTKNLIMFKSNIGINKFCKQFYDLQILSQTQSKMDKFPFFWEYVYDGLTNIDNDFYKVNRQLFRKEFVALQMGLFGLAFVEHLRDNDSSLENAEICDYLGKMNYFIKQHLKDSGDIDIWHSMIDYINSLMELKFVEATAIEKKLGLENKLLEVYRDLETEDTNRFISQGLDNDLALYGAKQMLVGGSWLEESQTECLTNELIKRIKVNDCSNSHALFNLLSGIIQDGIYFYVKDFIEKTFPGIIKRRKKLFKIIMCTIIGLFLFWLIYLDAPPKIIVVENDKVYKIIKERPVTRGVTVISREYYEYLLSSQYGVDY